MQSVASTVTGRTELQRHAWWKQSIPASDSACWILGWRFALLAVSYSQLHPCYASCMLTWEKTFLIFRPRNTIYLFFRKKVTKAIKSLQLFNRIVSYKSLFLLRWRKDIPKKNSAILPVWEFLVRPNSISDCLAFFQLNNSEFQKRITPNTHQTLCMSCFEIGQRVVKAQHLSYYKTSLPRNCLVLSLCFYCVWWSDYMNESHTV